MTTSTLMGKATPSTHAHGCFRQLVLGQDTCNAALKQRTCLGGTLSLFWQFRAGDGLCGPGGGGAENLFLAGLGPDGTGKDGPRASVSGRKAKVPEDLLMIVCRSLQAATACESIGRYMIIGSHNELQQRVVLLDYMIQVSSERASECPRSNQWV